MAQISEISREALVDRLLRLGIQPEEVAALEREDHGDMSAFCTAAIKVIADRVAKRAEDSELSGAAGSDSYFLQGEEPRQTPMVDGSTSEDAGLLDELERTTQRMAQVQLEHFDGRSARKALDSLKRSINLIEKHERSLMPAFGPTTQEAFSCAMIRLETRASRMALESLYRDIQMYQRLLSEMDYVRMKIPSVALECTRSTEGPHLYPLRPLPEGKERWMAIGIDPEDPAASLFEQVEELQLVGIDADAAGLGSGEISTFRRCTPQSARETLERALAYFEQGNGPFVLRLRGRDEGGQYQVRELVPSRAGRVLKLTVSDTTILDALSQKHGRDPLTKLLTRETLDYHFEQHLGLSTKSMTAVMMIDLDHFKKINDQFGHAKGDIVLVHAARVLEKAIGANDLVGRVGGEEFVAVLKDIVRADEVDLIYESTSLDEETIRRLLGRSVPSAEAAELRSVLSRQPRTMGENRMAIQLLAEARCFSRAEAIRRKVAAVRITGKLQAQEGAREQRIPVTASMGVVAVEGWATHQAAVEAADSALYRAKRRGRNRVEIGAAMTRREQLRYMERLAKERVLN